MICHFKNSLQKKIDVYFSLQELNRFLNAFFKRRKSVQIATASTPHVQPNHMTCSPDKQLSECYG